MRQRRLFPARFAAAAALLVVSFAAPAFAAPRTVAEVQLGTDWMPDVAERVASLRKRREREAVSGRERSDDLRNRQWWRRVAARPLETASR